VSLPLFVRLMSLYEVLYRIYMKVQATFRPRVQATTVFGARVLCDKRDFIQRRIAFFGLFEPNLTYFTSHVLKPGDVFIDVGANIGYFSMLASKCVGEAGKVYAIEAAPSTHELLVRNLALNRMRNVQPVNMAVADRECRVRIRSVDSRNIGKSKVEFTSGDEGGGVIGRPLPAIVGSDFGRATLIKVDVEGAEGVVLPGILNALASRNSGAVLVSEINPENAHLLSLANGLGFKIKAMPNNYSISNLLIRSLLRRTGEDQFYVLRDTQSYISDQYDYVFFREGAATRP